MSALPGVIGLLLTVYVKPHELSPALRDYSLIYLWFAVTAAGIARDVAARRARFLATPMLGYVVAFEAWCLFTLAARNAGILADKAMGPVVSIVLYLIPSFAGQRLSTFLKITGVIFALGFFVAGVGVVQGMSPYECVVYDPANRADRGEPDPRACAVVDEDGAPHDGVADCVASGKPGLAYRCERVGPFGTTSIGGRVRYVGSLQDPNDLALATAMSLPFAFAFYQVKKTVGRFAVLTVTLAVVAVEITFTQSRGGQLAFGAVLGAYFVQKYGWKRGALVGGVMAAPMLLLGGRSDGGADASTLERLGCAAAGIKMLRYQPLLGVGYAQFTEHHGLTAHNSYVLAGGELGLPGMWLFAFILYLAMKVPVTILRLPMGDDHESRVIKTMATAVLASLVGGVVGIFFLSWTYHHVFWIHLGLSAGLFALVKRRHPSYACRLGLREAAGVAVGYLVFLVVWGVYIKHRNAWE